MIFQDYEIIPYESEFYQQVIDLFKYLLGSDKNRNKDYFNWKYKDNPNAEYPIGIMALYKRRVVGFRGYCPLRFQIKDKNDRKLWVIKLQRNTPESIRSF